MSSINRASFFFFFSCRWVDKEWKNLWAVYFMQMGRQGMEKSMGRLFHADGSTRNGKSIYYGPFSFIYYGTSDGNEVLGMRFWE